MRVCLSLSVAACSFDISLVRYRMRLANTSTPGDTHTRAQSNSRQVECCSRPTTVQQTPPPPPYFLSQPSSSPSLVLCLVAFVASRPISLPRDYFPFSQLPTPPQLPSTPNTQNPTHTPNPTNNAAHRCFTLAQALSLCLNAFFFPSSFAPVLHSPQHTHIVFPLPPPFSPPLVVSNACHSLRSFFSLSLFSFSAHGLNSHHTPKTCRCQHPHHTPPSLPIAHFSTLSLSSCRRKEPTPLLLYQSWPKRTRTREQFCWGRYTRWRSGGEENGHLVCGSAKKNIWQKEKKKKNANKHKPNSFSTHSALLFLLEPATFCVWSRTSTYSHTEPELSRDIFYYPVLDKPFTPFKPNHYSPSFTLPFSDKKDNPSYPLFLTPVHWCWL